MHVARTATGALAQARASTSAQAHEGLRQLRTGWRVILQATVAATAAYALALAVGHEQPFFAPIAAIATVAVSLAQRLRRATELLLGNAVGIFFADLLIAQIGTGVWQLGLVVLIALIGALLLGGGPILIMQASSAAILIATITPPTSIQPWNTGRFFDALIGGGVGLAVAAVLMPVDPAKHARSATDPLLDTLARGYRTVSQALRQHDHAAAAVALADLRSTAPVIASFEAGLAATRESVRLAPWHWSQRDLLASYALAGSHLDNALRNLRVLARQGMNAVDRDEPVPPAIPDALDSLAEAAALLGPVLAGEQPPDQVTATLLSAVANSAEATGTAAQASPGLYTAPLAAQVRLSAADLLQAIGLTPGQTVAAVRGAGDAPTEDADPPA